MKKTAKRADDRDVQLEADIEAERVSVELTKRLARDLASAAFPIWRWGDGEGGYVWSLVVQEIQKLDAFSFELTAEPGPKKAAMPVGLHETLPVKEWQEWLERRRAKKWPVDKVTLGKQLKLLAKYDTDTQREIIDTSINAGWQGLFPPKGKVNGAGLNQPQTKFGRMMARSEANSIYNDNGNPVDENGNEIPF